MRLLLLSLLIFMSGTPAWAERVVVFAAASLKGPLDEIAASHPDVVISYGGSGVLARQVMQGAPADIVVLAHPVWMDEIAGAPGIALVETADLAGNRLVLIGPAGAGPLALTLGELQLALGADGRLAMGLTDAVPAGQYGRSALMSLGLWDGVSDRLAEVDNVRAALLLVARKEAPLGITYATDAQASDAVDIRATFDADSHPPIRYPAALLRDSPATRAFWAALTGDAGQTALVAAGFLP